jgi:hypothetical protein
MKKTVASNLSLVTSDEIAKVHKNDGKAKQ